MQKLTKGLLPDARCRQEIFYSRGVHVYMYALTLSLYPWNRYPDSDSIAVDVHMALCFLLAAYLSLVKTSL